VFSVVRAVLVLALVWVPAITSVTVVAAPMLVVGAVLVLALVVFP